MPTLPRAPRIVSSSPLVYGLARTYATYSDRVGREVMVFDEMRNALAWLGVEEMESTFHAALRVLKE